MLFLYQRLGQEINCPLAMGNTWVRSTIKEAANGVASYLNA
jgi:hypothetical protein